MFREKWGEKKVGNWKSHENRALFWRWPEYVRKSEQSDVSRLPNTDAFRHLSRVSFRLRLHRKCSINAFLSQKIEKSWASSLKRPESEPQERAARAQDEKSWNLFLNIQLDNSTKIHIFSHAPCVAHSQLSIIGRILKMRRVFTLHCDHMVEDSIGGDDQAEDEPQTMLTPL